MRHRRRIAACLLFAWMFFLGLFEGFLGGKSASAQRVDEPPPNSIDRPYGPYRRVFVRDSDLPLEGYRAMDLESFREMLGKRSKRAADLDPNSPDYETELRSFHSQVRLVGADLVSERSRLRWNWDRTNNKNQGGVRKLIAPWSPAIDTTSRFNGNQPPSSLTPPVWMYDGSGQPMVRVSSDEEWFSWTLRPLSTSTPNRLNYAPSFPRTIDSCMVLQLPKSFRVVDANIVVHQANNWNEVAERIGDWPAVLAATDGVPELNATDAFWLLELSGRDQANFSILVNPNRGFYDTLGSVDPSSSSWNRLIARQTVAHTVTTHHVKTNCDWEWFETTTLDRTFRIRVPQGIRLRNLKLNDRETSARFMDRVIELATPFDDSGGGAGSGGTSRMKVSAEFLSALSELGADSDGMVEIPPIECLNAYVVAGTTSLASDSTMELRNIRSGAGRLETARNSDRMLDRLDFSWFQSPPEISFEVASREVVDTGEILTRLSTDANRVVAVVKMQLSPWHLSAPSRIRIADGWSVETTQINHQGLELVTQEPDTVASESTLRIDPTGPVGEGPIQIELQLTRLTNGSLDPAVQSGGVVALLGRKTAQALVIEPEYASRLDYAGDFSQYLCDEETLTPWQRDRLPRLSRFLLFRMPNGQLPKLRWKEDPVLVECNIATTLSDEGECIRVEHLLDLNHGTASPDGIRIQMPGTWRWEWESPSGWTTFPAKFEPVGDWWHLDLPVPATMPPAASESKLLSQWRFRAISRRDKTKEPWQLPLPQLSSDQPATYTLRADALLQVIPDQARGKWRFDTDGDLVLRWQDPISDSVPMKLTVRSKDHGEPNRWWIPQSELHVAVDVYGQQRAVLELNAYGLRNAPLEFGLTLPTGWSLEKILDANSEPVANEINDSFSVRRDGEQHRICRQRIGTSSPVNSAQISVIISGPTLERAGFLRWVNLPSQSLVFSWPGIELEESFPKPKRILWTPDSVQVSGESSTISNPIPRIDSPRSQTIGVWSAWKWSAEAASWLGWTRADTEAIPRALQSANAAPIPPRVLIPAWIALDWKMAFSDDALWGRNENLSERFLLCPEPSRTGPALWLVIAILLSYSLLQRAPWVCLLIAGTATIAGHWSPDAVAIWFRSTWVGLGVGALVYLLRWIATSTGARPTDRPTRPEPWQPWNEPGLSNDGLSDSTSRAAVIVSLGLVLSMVMGLPMVAQDIASSARAIGDMPFDVLIPLDEKGRPSSEVVYVPNSVVSAAEVSPSIGPSPDRASYVISARHALRFDARSISFGNTEQPCTHTYEIWVGEAGVGRPMRIPFSSDRSRLSRFLIDSIEVASSRLAKSDTELIWYPDRPGRRTLQIESQIRILPSDREKSESNPLEGLSGNMRSPRAWSVDTPILPAGNAILDIETDAGWSVDFNRRGRFSNPSIGKFSIQLGNQERLTGEISPDATTAPPGGSVAVSDAGPLGSSDSPQMNTELFIDRGQLLARTIVEYPRAIDAPEEIELESDLQWHPIGNLWGEAKLIDVRPGSTLDRRRYIVRWIPDASGSTGKRLVTTTWIPVGNANLRNVLFAECRDRRVRPNTLRYARTAGSAWMLEGINTWVPSINTKERIEWMDLYERPIATSLRIPINGGFGVLRQQSESKVQRARVFHQFGVGTDRISIRSRIELANAVNNRKNVTLSIPSQYSVAEVLSRNTPLTHIEWSVGENRFIQVFIDREIGDASDLVVISEQEISEIDTFQSAWPVLAMEGVSIPEQFVELSADPVWRIQFASEASQAELRSVRGRGFGKPLVSMILPNSHGSSPIHLERLKGDWNGLLSAKILSVSEGEVRWQLRMLDNESTDAKPKLAISLPTEMSRNWKSDAAIKELPSLDPTRRWIQIQPDWGDGERGASFAVEWLGDAEAFREVTWIDRLRFESDPGLVCKLDQDSETTTIADRPDQESERASRSDASVSDASAPRNALSCQDFEVHRVEVDRQHPGRISMLSSWWIDRTQMPSQDPSPLEWVLPENTRVHWISIDGEGVYWRRDRNWLSVDLPPLAIPIRIDLWTDRDASPEDSLVQAATPAIVRSEGGCPTIGWLITDGEIHELGEKKSGGPIDPRLQLRRDICRRNLDLLAALPREQSEIDRSAAQRPTIQHRWSDYLLRETRSLLMAWAADTEHPDQIEYDAMVASFLELATPSKVGLQRPRMLAGDELREGMDATLCRRVLEQASVGRAQLDRDPRWDRLLSTLSMGLLVAVAPWIWLVFGKTMHRKAWWPLTLIGLGVWALTGTWVPALVLMLMGLFLAIDSYLILSGRFQQIGTRAPQ